MTAMTTTVLGEPVTQGSMKIRRGRITHDKAPELHAWRDRIAWAARNDMRAAGITEPHAGPVTLTASFYLSRPPSVTERARWAPWKKNDLDKLTRSLFDALVLAGLLIDDGQVVALSVSKAYADPAMPAGVTFTLTPALRPAVTA